MRLVPSTLMSSCGSFFNAFVRIPTFIDTELQTYTEKLLDETNTVQFKSEDLVFRQF